MAIEDAYERERTDVTNAPRTLDVDIIVVGDRISEDPSLILPHPRAHQRGFVLRPWADIEPDAEIPGRGPIRELLEQAGEDGVVRRDDLVLEFE
jgi:2-amino-4-hydroxy-6-hydroxymethyldihydropteridine diphosphokinase